MRVIRSAGQNVSPSDDGRLFDQAFTDGLFEDTTITHLGTNNVALGAMYGIICGRDFTAEAQTVAVELPEDDAGTTGYIYVEIDTSSDDVITIGSALAPFTPTYEDLNTNGAVAQMIIAEYVASSVAVTSLTATYPMASAGSVLPGSVATVEAATAVSNHAVGEFILWDGQMYIVTAAISVGEALVPGTNISATSAGAELSALKNGLTNLIQTVDLTVTTNSEGFAATSLYNKAILFIQCASHIALPLIEADGRLYIKILNGGNLTPYVQSNVSVTVYYLN